MNSKCRERLRRLSVSWLALTACIVIAKPSVHAYAIDVNSLQAKARQGFVAQQIELGEAYLTGKGVPQSDSNAEYWYEKAAGSGDTEAANMVAYMYQTGTGVAADPARAVRWFELSAASGCSNALLNLGVLHMMGIGVPKDPSRAAGYFRRAFERGNGTGAAYLGIMAYFGVGTQKDINAAEHWFKAGHKLDDPISTYDLGSLYSSAPSHSPELAKAAKYLRMAADANYVPAMQSLGILLIHHPELTRGDNEAIRRLQAAADAGSWQASLVLGVRAHTGNGTSVDNKAAYFHLRVAMLQGGNAARRLAESHISGVLSALEEQQARAIENDAATWFQQHSGTPVLVQTKGQAPRFFADPSLQGTQDILSAALPPENPAS